MRSGSRRLNRSRAALSGLLLRSSKKREWTPSGRQRLFFFVAYAVFVWYATAIRRRRWQGFAIAVAGLLGVAVVGYLHWLLNIYTDGRINLPVLQSILYPYGLLVFAVSVYIACLPRTVVPGVCHTCGYDLAGLATVSESRQLMAKCPECGRRSVAADA